MSSTDALKTKIRFLRNAAPQVYDQFFSAFADYTEGVVDILVTAKGDDWQVYQGHAQQCKKLMKLFEEVKNG